MKHTGAALMTLLLVGCGSAAPPRTPAAAVSETTSASVPKSEPKPEGASPAEPQVAASTKLDPLADDTALPTLERTPASELRPKTRADLDAALARAKIAGSVSAATANITKRLGKPTWIENGRTFVWVANGPQQCHRLILENDGTLALESAPVTETKMLSALAHQKLCTGDIERGLH